MIMKVIKGNNSNDNSDNSNSSYCGNENNINLMFW